MTRFGFTCGHILEQEPRVGGQLGVHLRRGEGEQGEGEGGGHPGVWVFRLYWGVVGCTGVFGSPAVTERLRSAMHAPRNNNLADQWPLGQAAPPDGLRRRGCSTITHRQSAGGRAAVLGWFVGRLEGWTKVQ